MGTVGLQDLLPEMTLRIQRLFPFLAVSLLIISSGASLSRAQRRDSEPKPPEPAEELVYEAEFSRALLRKIDIADFRFTAARLPLVQNGMPEGNGNAPGAQYTLQFTGEAKSKGFFAKLFNLQFIERIVSLVEPGSFTVQNTKRFDQQGSRVRASETVYDRAGGKLVWTERDPKHPEREPRVATAPFPEQVQDVVSAIYFLRSQSLAVGQRLELSISDSGRVYRVPVRVVEKKRMKTLLGRIDVFRVDVDLFGPDGMVSTPGRLSLWMTADSRHIPVKIKVKNEFGTFDITLRKVFQDQGRPSYLTKGG